MTSQLDPSLFFEPEPNPTEKLLYDKFIEEYVKDFNSYEAAQRVGFAPSFALEYSKVFLSKPYVQRAVSKFRHERSVETEADMIARHKQLMIASLLEVIQNGPFQTRVAATKVLAGIHGIDQSPDRSASELKELVDAFKDVAKALPE